MSSDGTFDVNKQRAVEVICHKPREVTSEGLWSGADPLAASLPLFMLQICLMIATTQLLFYALRPLRQPRVVSDVLAGIILGPSVLGRSKSWSEHIFPPAGERLVRTSGFLGMILFLFLIAIKMDPGLAFRSGKKPVAIAIMGIFIPLTLSSAAAFSLMKSIPADIARGPFLVFIPASISISSLFNIAQLLAELDLLNSELGKLALASSLLNDCTGWFFLAVFTAVDQGQKHPLTALWALMSTVAMIFFVLCIFRPWTRWIIRRVPRDGHVKEGYVLVILAGAVAMSFVSDFIGASIAVGPLIMGLSIPGGPPLGSAVIDRAELIVNEIILPLYFVTSGMSTDLSVITEWRRWTSLVIVIFAGHIGKFVAIMVTSLYCNLYLKNAFIMALIMNYRGIIDIMQFLNWWNGALVDTKGYTVILLSVTWVTCVVTPLLRTLYDPFSSPTASSVRTINQTRPNSELRILACVHSQEPVPFIINVLECIDTTHSTPVCVYVLHLVELVGRTTPLLITHGSSDDLVDPVLNAFVNYEQRLNGCVVVQPFTVISPYRTMHQDVYKLAEEKNVAFIIIPFGRNGSIEATISRADQAVRTMTPLVLANSPCSVGILIHESKAATDVPIFGTAMHNVAVVFWGGPDDREALALASRMTNKPGVGVTVLRYLRSENRGDEGERMMDDVAIDQFRINHANTGNSNIDKVVVEETVVGDEVHTIEYIRSLGGLYDLLILGRKPRTLTEGLMEWSECPELGVLGDMFASLDTARTCSVLVVQQLF